MKQLRLLALGLISLFAINVNAEVADPKTCLEAESNSAATCTLTADSVIDSETIVEGEKTLNLAGFKLTQNASIIVKDGAKLTITGAGEIYSDSTSHLFKVSDKGSLTLGSGTYTNEKYYGAIASIAGVDVYSGVTTNLAVLSDANLSANYGIVVVNGDDKASKPTYGVIVDYAGTFEGLTGNNGWTYGNVGITVNGRVKDADGTSFAGNIPEINITGGSITTKVGTSGNVNDDNAPAIYAAGFAKWNISGGTLEGTEALSIKAGEFNITGGTLTATGGYYNPALSYGNGTEATGAAISITATKNYAKDVKLTISDATVVSKNGNAIYEGVSVDKDGNPSTTPAVTTGSIAITGGTFESTKDAGKAAIAVSNTDSFISGGAFNTEIAEDYIISGLDEVVQDGVHYVGTKLKVNIVTVGEGTATANLTEAVEGQTVKLTISPAEGYKVKDIVVTSLGEEIECKDYSFKMPNTEVEVKITFEKEEAKLEDNKDDIIDNTEDKKEETKVDSTVSAESEETKNPETNDTVSTALTILGISLIGVISTLYIKKKYS